VILTGPLGAGKTTITQGIAEGLAVKGRVQSPTFTIVRTHKPGARGIRLLHMDAYRLLGEGVAESIAPGEQLSRDDVLDTLESLDIDADLDDAVLVAEWGRGVVEALADRVLDVEIARAVGAEGKGGGSAGGESGSADAGAGTGDDSDTADVVSDGGLADDGEGIDMTDGDENDPRETHCRWCEWRGLAGSGRLAARGRTSSTCGTVPSTVGDGGVVACAYGARGACLRGVVH